MASRVLRTGGLFFNGVDNRLRISNPTFGAAPANELSILLWFLIPNVEATQIFPGILRAETEGILFWTPKGADNRPTGNCTYYLDWANGLYVTAPYVIGAWNHAAVTFKRPTEKVYVNGVFKGSKDVDVPIPAYSWLDVGKGDNYSFPGMMVAQVLFYKRALSDAEISEVYTRGTLIKDGLVLCLPFYEGEGNIAHDVSSYGNHGTIYGASWAVKKALRVLPKAR